jgi:FKBP-type peptidyl-prolyl cis-trans isomerase
MRKTPVLIVIATLAVPVLFAQSRPFRRKLNPLSNAIVSVSRPTKVTGEGNSTPSGVQYWDIQIGEGSPATKGHAVKVLYKAWVENGKEFASSASDGRAPIFTLGAGQVIPGWEEGVEGMKAGGKRQLRIPPGLAYGAAGIPDLVPPDATLIFDVVLIELQ